VAPREGAEAAAWRFAWETTGFGRRGALRAVEVACPEPSGSRVTYRRAEFDEWYENSPAGLEQGFIVHTRPPGEGPLCVAGRLAGSLRAELRAEEGAVDLVHAGGARVLRYGELHVWDANGDELPSHISLDGAELTIRIEDGGAAYPITVDPLMTTPAWTREGNQNGANFGFSVATAGDVNGDGYSDVIVGARFYDNGQTDEGRAFVYHGSAAGLLHATAWTAESDQALAEFGVSLATAGDVNGDGYSDVIVGAYRYDNEQTGEGRAYVYHGSAAGLATTAAWTAESDQASALFGYSVATAGDVNGDGYSDVIVGAYQYDNEQTGEGRAYVYHGSAAGLETAAAWTAESDQASAHFGTSVATAGDVNGDGYSDVIVGALDHHHGQTKEGRAYVYHGSAAGLATTAAWTAESDQAVAEFGVSVATAGDVGGDGYSDVIVGAHFYDNGHTDEGRAFVYHGSATGLETFAAWTAESDQAGTEFGVSVATAGDVNGDSYSDVIVGAFRYDNGQNDEGRAYVYHGTTAVGVGELLVVAGFELSAIGSNPARGRCEVLLALGRRARVTADVIDATGRRVATLIEDATYEPGSHPLVWDGRDRSGSEATSGVYFIRVRADGELRVAKVVLLR
jgi:hypothetical protein